MKLDKKEIETICKKAETAQRQLKIREQQDATRCINDFLNLIIGSCNLNSQIKTQWTNKVFKDSLKPVSIMFYFDIDSDEFGITKNNFVNFRAALSQYLFSLGFSYYTKHNYSAPFPLNRQKEFPPSVEGHEIKRNFIKKLFKIPVKYYVWSSTIYGR